MASTSEIGHAKNVANFEDLISFCIGYGITYNPTNTNLKVAGLQAKNTAALAAVQTVRTTKTAFDNATNAREVAFDTIKKLSTRIVNALAATTALTQTVDDAKTINRKLQGKPKQSKTTTADPGTPADPANPGTPTPDSISASQQSFDSTIDNFTKLIQTITVEPLYAPNENELKVTNLNTLLTNLKTTNTSVINTTTTYSNGRVSRDSLLYAPHTGLVDTALDVKKYIKSLFGASSPQYKQVSALQFKNLNK